MDMDNTLWGKVLYMAQNFGSEDDMRIVDFLTGKDPRKILKTPHQRLDIQDRWNARQQKRNLARVVSLCGVPSHPDKM